MIKYYDSLTIPATLDSLSTIANYIKQVGNWANLHPKKVTKLRLAVDEIATNIIDYGYSQSQGKNVIELHAKLESSQLILWIEDTAIAYDPNQQQTPQDEGQCSLPGVYTHIKSQMERTSQEQDRKRKKKAI